MSNELWHKLRAEHIGGSEIAGLFNQSPYTTRFTLWHIKKGTIEAPDLSGNERIQAGNYLEAAIVQWANEKWNMNFKNGKAYVKHKDVKGFGCTPDAIDHDAKVMAQVKNVDGIVFGRDWEADGDNITNAPLHILLQVQHEMECADFDNAWLVVLVGGNRICRMMIERDRDLGALIRNEVISFWASIESNDQPLPDGKTDNNVFAQWRKASKINEVEIDMTGNNLLTSAARRYLEFKAQEEEAEKQKKSAAAEIMAAVGTNKKVKIGDTYITIVDQKGTPDSVITQAMVGNVVKGRNATSYPLVKQKAA